MTATSTGRPGRPPHAWLSLAALRALPAGTAVSIEQNGRHTRRHVGRIGEVTDHALHLATPRGELTLVNAAIRRGRLVPALYEPGDPVVRVDVPEDDWRGGVVKCEGREVLVEQIDGRFAWFPEADLEPADVRERRPQIPLPRGPVPASLP